MRIPVMFPHSLLFFTVFTVIVGSLMLIRSDSVMRFLNLILGIVVLMELSSPSVKSVSPKSIIAPVTPVLPRGSIIISNPKALASTAAAPMIHHCVSLRT